MNTIKTLGLITALVTISFTTATASITTTKANTTQTTSDNDGFNIIINDETIHVDTPLNPALTPTIVRITNAEGKEIYSEVVADGIDHRVVADGIDHRVVADGIDHRVVGDGIDHLVVGDGIDHRVVGDGIDHLRVEVIQNGIVIFEKEI